MALAEPQWNGIAPAAGTAARGALNASDPEPEPLPEPDPDPDMRPIEDDAAAE